MSFESNTSELERLLPLLDSSDAAERARVAELLAEASPAELALAAAYEADAEALAAFAETQRGPAPILIGFSDEVMARIAAGSDDFADGEDEDEERLAPIVRVSFGVQLWIAAAAVLMVGLGLGMLFNANERAVSQPPQSLAQGDEAAPLPAEGGPEFELAAPARPGMRSALGRRPRSGIVPVDGRGGGGDQRRQLLQELLRLQGLGAPSRVPPLREGERELDF